MHAAALIQQHIESQKSLNIRDLRPLHRSGGRREATFGDRAGRLTGTLFQGIHMFAVVMRRGMLAAAMLVSFAGASRLVAADAVPTDKLLPPNVLLYFSVPSCAEFHERFIETGFGQMVNDPAMADIREEVMKKFEEASEKAEKDIGMPLSDLLAIPSGEVSLAVVQPPGQKLGVIAFLDVGDHQDLLDQLLEKAEAGLKEDGNLTRSTDEFEGTEITVYTNENAGPNEPFTGFAWCVKDSMFLAGSSVDLLEAALVRWDGQHDKTFSTDATYKYIMDRCDLEGDTAPVMSWYFNPLGMLKAGMAAAGPEVGMQGAMVMGFLPVLGLDRLKGMGGVSDMATDEYEGISNMVIYVDQPVTGVLRALVCPPADQTPPAFIPAETANLNGLNWDVPGAYAAIEQVYDFFTQPGTFGKMMDDAATAENGPGLHPKDDFLDLLSGQIYMIQEIGMEEGAAQPQQKICMLFGLKDEARMQEVVAKLTSMEGVDVSVREFNGIKIYEAENPPAGQPMSPAAAVGKGHLMFSVNVELLESLLRGDEGDSLAKSEDYQLVRAEFPDQVSTFSFQRQDQVMEMLYQVIKQGLANDDEFDVELLPDFEALRKYFGVAGSYAVPDEKGVFISSFSFRKDE